jgi:hypothetical protein
MLLMMRLTSVEVSSEFKLQLAVSVAVNRQRQAEACTMNYSALYRIDERRVLIAAKIVGCRTGVMSQDVSRFALLQNIDMNINVGSAGLTRRHDVISCWYNPG